jgi:hypothetical protein
MSFPVNDLNQRALFNDIAHNEGLFAARKLSQHAVNLVGGHVIEGEDFGLDAPWSVLKTARLVGYRPQASEQKPGHGREVAQLFVLEKTGLDVAASCHFLRSPTCARLP